MVSLSRRKGPELWSSGVSSAWIGPAFGTTALSNYDVRVVVRVDGGGRGFLWVSMLVVARGFLRPVGGGRVEKMRISSTEEGEGGVLIREILLTYCGE